MLKSTGVVRKVDGLGRIVIPIELRRTMGIEEKDALEIYVDSEKIILKKYEPACIFCGNAEEVVNYKGKIYAKAALLRLSKQVIWFYILFYLLQKTFCCINIRAIWQSIDATPPGIQN